ncbi:MAG: PHB depolymerase family esterase [bacterium]
MKLRQGIVLASLIFLGACSGSASNLATVPNAPNPATPVTPTTPNQAVAFPGDYKKTLSSGGLDREYILHIPKNYDGSKPLPLMFILHGNGGTAQSMLKSTGMNDTADKNGFFVAYLQGTVESDGKPTWNCGITPNAINIDDVGYFRDVANQIQGEVKVDSKRIYASGFSAGASMTYRLGAELPDILAGIAIVEGSIAISTDNGVSYKKIPTPKGPIPVAIIHGMEDQAAPYDGGPGSKYVYASVAEAVNFWTTADGCSASLPEKTSPDGNVIAKRYVNCTPGTEVQLFTIVNGEHQWPTLEGDTHFPGSDVIWNFFNRIAKSDAE